MQVLLAIVKSPGFAPLKLNAPSTRLALPVLVMVIGADVVADPTAVLAKTKTFVDRVRIGAVGVAPVPLIGTDEFPAFVVIAS